MCSLKHRRNRRHIMATFFNIRKVYTVLLKETFDFRHCRQSLASVKSYASGIHTCCKATEDFDKDLSKSLKDNCVDQNSDICFLDDGLDKRVNLSNLNLTEEELSQYPIRGFKGNIYVVKEPSNERDLEILSVLNKLKSENVLGFDAEMSESPRLDGNFKRKKITRVLQIASQTDAIVWQLKHFKSLPSSLEFFLNSDILKVGHAISEDLVLLKKEFNINSRCLFDTLPWAMELNCKPLGLHALCAIFLGWRISKGLRTSDWNRNELSVNQIHYACTDAWASLMLYNKMKRVGLENGLSESMPLPIASVNDFLDTRLLSRRKRRNRLLQNNKARKHFNTIVETATKIVE